MTAKDLIQQLSNYPLDMEVCGEADSSSNYPAHVDIRIGYVTEEWSWAKKGTKVIVIGVSN